MPDRSSIGAQDASEDEAGPAIGWEFPKIGGTLFWGPYNKDPTI